MCIFQIDEMSNLPPIPRPLEGDVDKSYQLEIGATVTFVAAAVVVGLRFLARSLYARLGWDDHLMLFAVVCNPASYAAKGVLLWFENCP